MALVSTQGERREREGISGSGERSREVFHREQGSENDIAQGNRGHRRRRRPARWPEAFAFSNSAWSAGGKFISP